MNEIFNIQFKWWNDGDRILIITIEGRWRWRDLEPSLAQLKQIDEGRASSFDVIVDARKTTLYEPNLVTYVRDHPLQQPLRHLRLLLLVGLDEYTQVLWNGVAKMPFAAFLKAQFFDTVEEAVQFAQGYNG